MVLSTIGFSFSHTIIRYLSPEIHSFQIVFFRAFFGLFVVSPWIIKHGITYLSTKRFPLHFFRTICAVLSMSSFYYALGIIPLAKATAIGFLAPVLCSFLVVLLLREKTRSVHWWAMGLGLGGMLIIIRPGMIEMDFGTLLMLFSTAFFAINLFCLKLLSKTEATVVITSYTTIMLVPLSIPMASQVWVWPNPEQWFWLVLMGGVTGVSLLLFTQAVKEALTTVVMPLDFLRMLWMTLAGFWLFAESPDTLTWVGGGIVFSGTLLIALSERGTSKNSTPKPK
jgi:drug/metabolite transporter (DMT)-like permease